MGAMSYFYIFLTIMLTVYGQIAIKWQVLSAGPFPSCLWDKLVFLSRLLLNPWVVSALLAALMASVSWMAAMTRLQLSYAYPFMSFTFVLVMILSGVFFHEPVTPHKIIGMGLIIAGIVIGSQG